MNIVQPRSILMLVCSVTLVWVIYAPFVCATSTVNGYVNSESKLGAAAKQDRVSSNKHTLSNGQKGLNCKHCEQFLADKKHKEGDKITHHRKKGRFLENGSDDTLIHKSKNIQIILDKISTDDRKIDLLSKSQHLEERQTESRNQQKSSNTTYTSQPMQPFEDNISLGKLSTLTTQEQLERYSNAPKVTKKYNDFGNKNSRIKSDINLKVMDNKGKRTEQDLRKQERKFTIFSTNTEMEGSKKLTTEATLAHSKDLYPTEVLSDSKNKYINSDFNKLPQIKKIKVNIHRKGKESFSRHGDLFQSFQNTTRYFNNKTTMANVQNYFSNSGLQMLSEKNSSSSGSIKKAVGKKNEHDQRISEDHKSRNENRFYRTSNYHSSIDDTYVADESKKTILLDAEWSSDQPGTPKRRGDLKENLLVRPSDADRLEQHNSLDLSRSYRLLMNHLNGMLQMFSHSFQVLNSYNEEIFNGTRYDLMMGAREIFEKIHEANDYIYDGVNAATQFTREIMMKYHNNRNSKISGRLQEAPLTVLESQVQKRNFQPHLKQTNEEQRKAEEVIKNIKLMKIKHTETESKLKKVRELFDTSYHRPAIQDLFRYINTSIIQINGGMHMSSQLRQLKRGKIYMDHVKNILMTANNLLINSSNRVHKGLKQFQENKDMYIKWLQREHNRQKVHNSEYGFQRDSQLTVSSDHFEKLQQLVFKARTHASELQSQQNQLQSMLYSSIDAAKVVVARNSNNTILLELKFLTRSLKPLLKDMLASLDILRIYIGSKTIISPKLCRSPTEGSGLIESDDDEDLCEEYGSGFEISDKENVFATDDEDFTFISEPDDSAHPPVHSVKQLSLDLKSYTSKMIQKSQLIHDSAQSLQTSLAGLLKRWRSIESSISGIEKSTELQKDYILDLEDSTRSFQEVKSKIQNISHKIANFKTLNLDEAVEKAQKALEKNNMRAGVDARSTTKVKRPEEKKEKLLDGTDKLKKLEDDIDYSGLFKHGQDIMSNHADIKFLRSVAIANCGKIGNHFTYIKNNMSMLRHKVEKARQMLTTMQLSISKSGSGHISLSIPRTQPETTTSLTTSIRVCIRPKSLDGTLLLVTGNNSASYSVTLDNGKIAVATYNKENYNIGTVTLDDKIITEQWYTLEIERIGETLQITAVSQTGNSQTKSETVSSLELLQPLPLMTYIGGLPESFGISGESWEGCVGELTVNGRALTLFDAKKDETNTSLCTDHCISDTHKLSMVFNGNGFAHFIRSESERISLVTLKFKTHQKMASLLSVINKNHNFALIVVLANGALKIESSSPIEKIVLLSLNSSLNDGQNHFLRIVYKGSRTYPELDGNKEAFSVERAAPPNLREILDGVLVGALVSDSRQFLTTPFRSFIGCVGDIFINDERLSLPDAADTHNTFHGNCRAASVNVWHSCWQWTDVSKPLSFGVVENSNRISLLVSRNSLGPLIHFIKEEKYDIEVSLTSSGIDVSSSDAEGVMIRPERDNSFFTLITISDDGTNVFVKAWDQSVSFKYGSFWGFARKDLTTPHIVVLGEPRDGKDRMFTGFISQFTIEDRLHDLSQFKSQYNLSPCERPLEEIPPVAVTETEESFSCV